MPLANLTPVTPLARKLRRRKTPGCNHMNKTPTNDRVTVLIVDDSVLYRRFVRNALSDISGVEIVGHASNGNSALQQIKARKPNVIILDIHMPGTNGIDVLRSLQEMKHRPEVIVLTSKSESSIENTTLALELGAFDFVLKPDESSAEVNHQLLVKNLERRISAIASSGGRPRPTTTASTPRKRKPAGLQKDSVTPDIIAIGVSTGGPAALMKVLPAIPANFSLPILVVQHMPPMFTKSLALDLNGASALQVHEATEGMAVQPGNVYIAPGGRQMKIEQSFPAPTIRITDSPAENHCKPSVDYLLRSVASVYGRRSLVAILTGMGSDGCAGCKLISEKGGTILTQSANTCVVYGMPRSVDEAGLSQESCTLEQISARIIGAVEKEEQQCQP